MWTCHTWNKCNIENAIFFQIMLKTTVCEFNNFSIGTVYVYEIQKEFV